MDIRNFRTDDDGGRSRPGWLASLGVAPADNSFEAELQLSKVRRAAVMWRAAVYSQLIAAFFVVAGAIWLHAYSMLFGAAISAGVMLMVTLGTHAAFHNRKFWRMSPVRQNVWAMPVAAALGAATAVLGAQALALPHHDFSLVLVGGVAIAAVITLLAMLSMHLATLAYTGAATIALVLATGNLALANIGVLLMACIWTASVAHARFDNYLSGERQQSEGDSRRASRLLAEFEANGAGWFWETDRTGRLVYLSHKLAEVIGKRPEELLGRQLTDLICSEGNSQDGERTLGFHLSSRSSFTEITVRAAIEDEECYWSLSGRPIIDDIGQFRGFAGSGTDLTEKRRSENEAQQLARYDSLTGLANRQHMRNNLEEALGDPDSAPRSVTLMLLDLDRFKSVNDTMGHPVGDALLKQVASRLFRTVGEQGMVGRLGGDEFQVMLPGIEGRTKQGTIAKSIIEALSQPYMIDGVTLSIGCSIGIALAPEHGRTPEELIRNGDLALYAAKGDGRGVYRIYENEMHTGAKKRKRLEDDLRNALANGELHLSYQPIVSTESTKIVGYETLIRWTHPSRGSISPADFIPVAEDIRLIEQIGEWVLRKACDEAAKWPIAARVAVNVSPIQFANPNLPKIVMSALAKSGLAPDRLELEITESVFLDEGMDTDQMFKALKRTGVRLALDDFGTGYSALGYLKTAPFDKIKIDQSFIRGAAVPGNRNAAIIKAIVALANTLYMETTAEGVELEDEIELVRELGCSHIQGFIYGKPMPNEEVHRQLNDGQGKAIASGYRASRSPRTKVLRSSSADFRGKSHKVLIRNISATGAMIEGLDELEADSDVLIELLEDQMFPAKVRWSKENRVGLEFAKSFDLERFNTAAARQPVRKAANG